VKNNLNLDLLRRKEGGDEGGKNTKVGRELIREKKIKGN